MRLVLDTNIVIAALLWHGPPRQLLDQIIDRSDIELYSSSPLLSELSEVLLRPRFAQRINVAGLAVTALLADMLTSSQPLYRPHFPNESAATLTTMKYLHAPSQQMPTQL